MIRKIVKYGDPVLRMACEPVTEFNTTGLDELVEDMFETMNDANGVGLAAPQIGLSKSLAVVGINSDKESKESSDRLILINPKMLTTEGEQVDMEGCLSIPGFSAPVKRPWKVTIRAQGPTGDWFELVGEGLLARAILHENDHLNGILFLKHISRLKREMILRKIRKLRQNGEWG